MAFLRAASRKATPTSMRRRGGRRRQQFCCRKGTERGKFAGRGLRALALCCLRARYMQWPVRINKAVQWAYGRDPGDADGGECALRFSWGSKSFLQFIQCSVYTVQYAQLQSDRPAASIAARSPGSRLASSSVAGRHTGASPRRAPTAHATPSRKVRYRLRLRVNPDPNVP